MIDSTGALDLADLPTGCWSSAAGSSDWRWPRVRRARVPGDCRRGDGPAHPRCGSGPRSAAGKTDQKAVREHLPGDQGDQRRPPGRWPRGRVRRTVRAQHRHLRQGPGGGRPPSERQRLRRGQGGSHGRRPRVRPGGRRERTNVPHIFAVGDVVGQPMLAHKAVHEGRSRRRTQPGRRRVRPPRHPGRGLHRPRGRLGRCDRERGQGRRSEVRQGRVPVGRLRSVAVAGPRRRHDEDPRGRVTDRIIGCGIVGPSAGDLISRRHWPSSSAPRPRTSD